MKLATLPIWFHFISRYFAEYLKTMQGGMEILLKHGYKFLFHGTTDFGADGPEVGVWMGMGIIPYLSKKQQ